MDKQTAKNRVKTMSKYSCYKNIKVIKEHNNNNYGVSWIHSGVKKIVYYDSYFQNEMQKLLKNTKTE